MKKKLIVIALALLVVASVFAESFTQENVNAGTATVSTTVQLELAKTPKYIIGIKTGKLSSINETDPSQTTISNTNTIQLTRDALTFKDATNNYYLSFLLYEYDAVKISMTLNGNLQHTDYATKSAASAKDLSSYEIPYQVKVASGKDTTQKSDTSVNTFTETTLVSNGTKDADKTWEYSYNTATTKLGEYAWASLQLTISPVAGDSTPLKDKATGTFKNTITVAVTANS